MPQSRLDHERAEVPIGEMVFLGIALVIAAILFVTIATQSDVADFNASINKTTGASELVLLLPFVGLGIVIVMAARQFIK